MEVEIIKTIYYGYHKNFSTKEEALAACDVKELDTDGMIWNGEIYYDRDKKESWWPVYETEIDEDNEPYETHILGYIKGY